MSVLECVYSSGGGGGDNERWEKRGRSEKVNECTDSVETCYDLYFVDKIDAKLNKTIENNFSLSFDYFICMSPLKGVKIFSSLVCQLVSWGNNPMGFSCTCCVRDEKKVFEEILS